MKIGIKILQSGVFGKCFYSSDKPKIEIVLADMMNGTFQGSVKRMSKYFLKDSYKEIVYEATWEMNESWFNK